MHTNTTQISARRQFSNCEDLSVHSTRAGSRLHGKSRCPNPSPPDPVHGRSSPRKCTPPCLFFSVCGPPTPTAVSRTSNEGTPEHDNDTEASKRCLSRPSVVRRSVGRRSVVGQLSVGRFVTKRQQLSPVTVTVAVWHILPTSNSNFHYCPHVYHTALNQYSSFQKRIYFEY